MPIFDTNVICANISVTFPSDKLIIGRVLGVIDNYLATKGFLVANTTVETRIYEGYKDSKRFTFIIGACNNPTLVRVRSYTDPNLEIVLDDYKIGYHIQEKSKVYLLELQEGISNDYYLEVTSIWGFTTMPADLLYAVEDICLSALQNRQQLTNMNIKSSKLGDASVTYQDKNYIDINDMIINNPIINSYV